MKTPATVTIRIDAEVYAYLKKKALPLVDTPNSVLRRLLKIEKRRNPGRPKTKATEWGTIKKPKVRDATP